METLHGAAGAAEGVNGRARERAARAAVLLLLLANGSLIAGVYAAAAVAVRHGVTPLGILAWQLGFAATVLGLLAALTGRWPRIDARRLRYALVAGLLGVSLPNAASFTALSQLPAAVVGVVAALSPVFTYALVVGLRMERPTPGRIAGLVLGLLGVGWVLWPRDGVDLEATAVLALAAPALLAAGNVYRSLAWPPGLVPLGAAALMLAGQALFVLPLAAVTGELAWPVAIDGAGGAALWGVGAMTATFYLGAFELQRRGGAVVTGQLGYVITLASLAIGVVAFRESHQASTWLGAAVAIAGVLLVLRGGPRQEKQP